MNAPRRSNTLMGTFEKNALAVWWDEVVLFVSLYTIVFFVNLWFALVAWASSGWTRWFAGLLFWAEAWCPAWPVELRCGLALGCAVPLAWLCYLWTARAVCGRTLSLCLSRNAARLYTPTERRVLGWLTLGAFTTRPTRCPRYRAVAAVVVCTLALSLCASIAWGWVRRG